MEEPSGGLVPCPDCDSHGKIACPECDGRGEVFRVCGICKGSGEKPCPVCTKSEDGAAPGQPGLVPCGFCGGRGSVGPQARTCSRCAGAGLFRCDACAGKGTVACRREIFVRVCPRCRFAGKIVCPTCGGARQVSQAVALSRSSGSSRAARSPTRSSEDDARPEKSEARAAPSENGFPTIAELEVRLKDLSSGCEAHKDIFVEDLTYRSENLRTAALELSRTLSAAGVPPESDVSMEIEALMERAKSFRRRWYELRDLYEEERRSYESVQKNWGLREAALQEAKGRQKDSRERSWNERLDLLLRILQKNTVPLRAEDVTWIPKELEDLDRTWLSLKARAEEEVVAAKESAALSKAQEPSPATSAGAAPPTVPAGSTARSGSPAARESSAGIRATAEAGSGRSRSAPSRAPEDQPPSPARAKDGGGEPRERAVARRPSEGSRAATDTAAADSRDGTSPGPSGRRAAEPAAGGSAWKGALWALLGFALASILFLLRARRRREDELEIPELLMEARRGSSPRASPDGSRNRTRS